MAAAALFIDFDGTISTVDISNTFFSRFADSDAMVAVDEWKRGLISSRECLKRELDAYHGSLENLKAYAQSQPIDEGFISLRDECRRRGIEIFVVSDGLDFYIKPFLASHGQRVDFYANRLELKRGKRILTFPYYNEACGSCANCKSMHVEREKEKGKFVVYVGDGLSDKCPVLKADMVFAKGDLKEYCESHGIAHIGFQNLSEVAHQIRSSNIGDPLKS